MPKTVVEFNCYECSHYVYVRMNTDIDGNYVMNCPNCGHRHYRVIKKGIITDKRFDENYVLADELIVPKSAAVPYEKRRPKSKVAAAYEAHGA